MQLGKYQLVRKLAAGGMAEVFLVKAAGARGFEKTLVLKRILPHLAEDEAFVEMFLSEAKLAAQLDHPNVVQIFDFGEADGSYFLAMEYIDGPTLRRLIKRSAEQQAPLPPALCAKMVAAAAEGLAFAHELTDAETGMPLGLVHRDVSPENILVSRQGSVKVVDFGIAKVAGQGHRTQTGVVKGKVAYMPPEQLQGRSMDGRVDVYALGMVLYELLTCRRPFEATTEASMMQAILFEPFVPAVERRHDLPEMMQRILAKALAKDRDERYQDCRALQADLERFVLSLGEPVGAYQIARLVAQVTEGGAAVPTPAQPVRVDAKNQETASQTPDAEGKGTPNNPNKTKEEGPRGAVVLTTPMPIRASAARERLASEKGLEGREAGRGPDSMKAPMDAPTVTPGLELELSAFTGVANTPATPPKKADAPASRRGAVVASVVALGVLVLVGGWVAFGRSPKDVAPPVAPPAPGLTDGALSKEPTPAREAPVPAAPPEAPPVVTDAGGADAVAPEPAESVSPGAPDAGSLRKAPVRRPTLARGRLEFRIRPFAMVYLDGRPLGQTPFGAVETTEGRHQIRVVNKDLEKDVTKTFEVKAGQENVFKLNLQTE
ncbi:serine/threonine-protein kinase [Corallococcus llansteffanensis]|uniref:PEGA domain-containing protein n=1 Tax=Corallococcus llansteffanensis TaxID=2316731 RepID=A0A3A8PK98_9BACT|nr:serine/threonine-protein kinase [Corallococcus llansteffanensis]RKH55091.1 PEGA domain-containing protein [Corallococcus llansteffanensis]